MAGPATAARGGAHRSWGQRLLISFNLAVIAVFVAGSAGLGWFYWRFDRIPRVTVGNLASQPKGDPQNYLLVGSDTRDFVAPGSADAKAFGGQDVSNGSGRSDTIIVVRIDPQTNHASMVSFPRDLWVQIPGHGHAKINTAFLGDAEAGLSGPELLIQTLKLNFGIDISHFIQVDFQGFKGLVDAVGGVTVYLAAPVRDWDTTVSPPRNETGLDIRQTGCVELDGTQALAYVRSRHFESLQPDGRWKGDQQGDFGRMQRQQDFIRRAVNKVIGQDLFNPIKLNQLVGVASDNVTFSSSIKVDDLVKLAKGFKSLSSGNLTQYKLPVDVSSHGSQSTVDFVSGTEADREAIFDVFRGIDPDAPLPPPSPSSLTVRVLNGTGVPGQAGDVAEALRDGQFGTVDTGNAQHAAKTVIRYASGQQAAAQLLQRYLVAGATLESAPSLEGVDLVLVTGGDFAGVLTEPRDPGEAAPTTTTTPTTPPATSSTHAGTTTGSVVPDC
jgi:LCP family protein required for cell wall assembly